MSIRSERVLVGLHEVELWAEVPTFFRAVTVLERIARVVNCRHEDSVERGEAATAGLAEVDVERDASVEQINLKVLARICVVHGREVHTIVVIEGQLPGVRHDHRCPVGVVHVEFANLIIYLDFERGEVSLDWLSADLSRVGRGEIGDAVATASCVGIVEVRGARPAVATALAVDPTTVLVGKLSAILAPGPEAVHLPTAAASIRVLLGLTRGPG